MESLVNNHLLFSEGRTSYSEGGTFSENSRINLFPSWNYQSVKDFLPSEPATYGTSLFPLSSSFVAFFSTELVGRTKSKPTFIEHLLCAGVSDLVSAVDYVEMALLSRGMAFIVLQPSFSFSCLPLWVFFTVSFSSFGSPNIIHLSCTVGYRETYFPYWFGD